VSQQRIATSVPAAVAAPRAAVKAAVEVPLLASLGQRLPDARWKELAARHAPDIRFAPESLALMRDRYGASEGMIAALRETMAQDTLRNEYDLHARIHQWLAAERPTFEALNKRVYAELFLTPASDPWLGLKPVAFTATVGG
jgi:hypothetical protein